MFRRGFRLFSAATLVLLLTAVAHSIGHLSPPSPDPAMDRALAAMREARIPMPMTPNLEDVLDGLSWTMTLLLLVLGVQNALLARWASDPAVLKPHAVLAAGGSLILAAVYLRYRIAPPMVTFAVAGVLYAAAAATMSRAGVTGSSAR